MSPLNCPWLANTLNQKAGSVRRGWGWPTRDVPSPCPMLPPTRAGKSGTRFLSLLSLLWLGQVKLKSSGKGAAFSQRVEVMCIHHPLNPFLTLTADLELWRVSLAQNINTLKIVEGQGEGDESLWAHLSHFFSPEKAHLLTSY